MAVGGVGGHQTGHLDGQYPRREGMQVSEVEGGVLSPVHHRAPIVGAEAVEEEWEATEIENTIPGLRTVRAVDHHRVRLLDKVEEVEEGEEVLVTQAGAGAAQDRRPGEAVVQLGEEVVLGRAGGGVQAIRVIVVEVGVRAETDGEAGGEVRGLERMHSAREVESDGHVQSTSVG